MEKTSKHCKFCNETKSLDFFGNARYCKMGVSNKCKQCVKKYREQYNTINKEKILEYNLQYNKIYNPEWGNKNKHIVKWRNIIHRCIKVQGKYKNTKTQILLGYTYNEFKKHIENQFTISMNWDNISIDHKIPLTWFKHDTPIHIINDLRNLQPLFKHDNISKLNRYSDPVDVGYFSLAKEHLVPEVINMISQV